MNLSPPGGRNPEVIRPAGGVDIQVIGPAGPVLNNDFSVPTALVKAMIAAIR